MTDKDAEKVSAMVDFYSDRAVAHASFFLAFLFGLFSILSLAQNPSLPNRCIWGIPYWLLFLGSLHTFANFRLYAVYAEKITQRKSLHSSVKSVLDDAKRGNPFVSAFQAFKDNSRNLLVKVIMFSYFLIAFLSCLLVIGVNVAIYGSMGVLTIIAVAWLYALYKS